MSDTIYRQDAVEAHCELCPDKYICCPIRNGNICPEFEVFRLLPSAQPVNYGSTKSDSSSQLKLNNDLISRQAAIDALDGFRCGTKAAWKVIEDLPSAQPHKKGRWIILPPIFEEICQCSKCKMKFKDALQWTNYCPNCGADMRGESNE